MLTRVLIRAGTLARSRALAKHVKNFDCLAVPLSAKGDLWKTLGTTPFDLLLIDEAAMDSAADRFIGEIRSLPGAPRVVVLVEDADADRRARLQAARAFAIVDVAAENDRLSEALSGVLDRFAESLDSNGLSAARIDDNRLSDFSTSSPAMRDFLGFVRRVVESDSTLLVLGETGTGKEYLSRAIHTESPRSQGPFVAVNCAALSESLLESELFGHVEGAFTGARRGHRGYFELAHGGTLFLDEIGELRPATQVKLLRVLQDRCIQPVGGEELIEIDVRLIAATNRNLTEAVQNGKFRSDLFYRLSVVELDVPSLRARSEDIPDLFQSHVEHFRIAMNRPIEGVSEDALRLLTRYEWPGNVRELINVAERAVLLCESHWIVPSDLPEEIRGNAIRVGAVRPVENEERLAASEDTRPSILERPFKEARNDLLAEFERSYFEKLLSRCHGRVNDASRLSGLNPRSLYEKLRRLGIEKKAFKL